MARWYRLDALRPVLLGGALVTVGVVEELDDPTSEVDVPHGALRAHGRRWAPSPAPPLEVTGRTGVVELVLGAALAHPAGRRRAAQLTAAPISAHLTAHLDGAVTATPRRTRRLDRPGGVAVGLAGTVARLGWSAHAAVAGSRVP